MHSPLNPYARSDYLTCTIFSSTFFGSDTNDHMNLICHMSISQWCFSVLLNALKTYQALTRTDARESRSTLNIQPDLTHSILPTYLKRNMLVF